MTAMPRTICGVCAAEAPPPYRPPAAELSPDLDFRPGEPARSTLARWVVRCPACGAVAADLSKLAPVDRPAVDRLHAEPPPVPHAGRLHWLAGALADASGDPDAAFAGFLGAAWAADDAGDAAAALGARARALAAQPVPPGGQAGLRHVDVRRRAGLFESATALAKTLAAVDTDPSTAAILAFQQARIAERDMSRHLLSSALRPPARTPHVLHGREAAPGFFGRLFGR